MLFFNIQSCFYLFLGVNTIANKSILREFIDILVTYYAGKQNLKVNYYSPFITKNLQCLQTCRKEIYQALQNWSPYLLSPLGLEKIDKLSV